MQEFDPEFKNFAKQFMDLQRSMSRLGIKTTKEDLVGIGGQIWENSYRYTENDAEAFERLISTYRANGYFDQLLVQSMMLPNQQLLMMGSALWYHTGLHQILMGHKFASSLLATRVTPDIVEYVRPPWRSFYITLPDRMFFTVHPEGERLVPITGILVMHVLSHDGSYRWAYSALTDSTLTLWRHGYTTEMLLSNDVENGRTYDPELFSEKMDDIDLRTTTLIGRLIVNICLAMSDPTNIEKQPPRPYVPGKHERRAPGKPPLCRTYVLGKPTTLDCRKAIQEYVLTGKQGRELTSQMLVAGHYKNQPHGPKNSLRKIVRIEPYWRGPEDAPILVNPTKLR